MPTVLLSLSPLPVHAPQPLLVEVLQRCQLVPIPVLLHVQRVAQAVHAPGGHPEWGTWSGGLETGASRLHSRCRTAAPTLCDISVLQRTTVRMGWKQYAGGLSAAQGTLAYLPPRALLCGTDTRTHLQGRSRPRPWSAPHHLHQHHPGPHLSCASSIMRRRTTSPTSRCASALESTAVMKGCRSTAAAEGRAAGSSASMDSSSERAVEESARKLREGGEGNGHARVKGAETARGECRTSRSDERKAQKAGSLGQGVAWADKMLGW